MDNVLYQVWLEYYDEIDNTVKEEKGLLTAFSFSDAINKIETYWGKQELQSIKYLSPVSDWEIITKDIIDKINWELT